jgi:hypothetical protein
MYKLKFISEEKMFKIANLDVGVQNNRNLEGRKSLISSDAVKYKARVVNL